MFVQSDRCKCILSGLKEAGIIIPVWAPEFIGILLEDTPITDQVHNFSVDQLDLYEYVLLHVNKDPKIMSWMSPGIIDYILCESSSGIVTNDLERILRVFIRQDTLESTKKVLRAYALDHNMRDFTKKYLSVVIS